KPALLLTPREAALLAVSLPNPFERQAGRTGPRPLRLPHHPPPLPAAGPATARCASPTPCCCACGRPRQTPHACVQGQTASDTRRTHPAAGAWIVSGQGRRMPL